ncbi:MAG: FABP family protein [Nitrospinae bacterium CG11_big_fil_rev_8_21_14_0_20_45_15]|nr:MAG: FABP family protein [Nitrospinae bacterium CG11_big_fil_rev_8_21_14_0_20_45_15]
MTDDIIKNLGPLRLLAGIWEGEKGKDTAPSKSREAEITPFRERMVFTPMGPVDNHEQRLYGLRYSTTAWPSGQDQPFHEELGYWLWDATEKQVFRCFMVPRGVTIIAGGTVEPSATAFELSADLGSQTYGICSNPFLDREFKTVRYELMVTLHDAESFSYEEDVQLQIKGQSEIFHHRDKNTLKRVE